MAGVVKWRWERIRLYGLIVAVLFGVCWVLSSAQWFKSRVDSRAGEVAEADVLLRTISTTDPGTPTLQSDVIHVAMILVGSDATRAFVTVLKSILLLRRNALHFHLVTDDGTGIVLKHLFDTWQISAISISMYSVHEAVSQVAWVKTVHESGIYGLSKLHYEELLPKNVTKLITIDTDVVFLSDIMDLWSHFDYFDDKQLFGCVLQQSGWYLQTDGRFIIWPAKGIGINTGIMLLNLQQMRASAWSQKWTKLTRNQLAVTPYTALADQDVYNLVVKHYPELLYSLPCGWNLQIHGTSTAADCYRNEHVHLLHWNSPQKQRAMFEYSDYFLTLFWRIRQSSGTQLRVPPLPMLGKEDHRQLRIRKGLPIPNPQDPCFEFHLAASRAYRTHMNYYSRLSRTNVFQCHLSNGNIPTSVLPKYTKVIAPSHVEAEQQFLRFLKKSKQRFNRHNAKLPNTPALVCIAEVKEQQADTIDVTLGVHLSFNRLPALSSLLKAWDGHISIVIYMEDFQLKDLSDFVEETEVLQRSTDVFFHVVYKEGNHYPINYLRNVARMASRTTYTFMIDADFLPSKNCYQVLKDGLAKARITTSVAPVFVVPAFETALYHFEMPPSVAALKLLWQSSSIKAFRMSEWPKGHKLTQYDTWFRSENSYATEWNEGAEPYLVLHRSVVGFDEHFTGFGWNKVTHVRHIHQLGHDFVVLPHAFIVHLPHAPSQDLLHYRNSDVYKRCLEEFMEESIGSQI